MISSINHFGDPACLVMASGVVKGAPRESVAPNVLLD